MKYYEIYEKIYNNMSTFRFVVESKDVAEDVCKRHPILYYKEVEYAPTIMTDASPCIIPIEEPKGLYTDIKCPHCGASHFILRGGSTTLVYCPTIIKDGKVISKDINQFTQEYECLECGKTWRS